MLGRRRRARRAVAPSYTPEMPLGHGTLPPGVRSPAARPLPTPPMLCGSPRAQVFTENRREVAYIASSQFGEVAFVAIGATLVGSVVIEAAPGSAVKKGDPFGYFAYGGSTTIALFQKGRAAFDEDVRENSRKQIETLVKMGEHIGDAAAPEAQGDPYAA